MKYVAVEETLSRFDWHWVPSLGLVLFISIFICAFYLTMSMKGHEHYARMAIDEEGDKHE